MSILDTLVTPLVAPIMLLGMTLPTGQSPAYATETHDIKTIAVEQSPTMAEIRKARWKATVSRTRMLANHTGTPQGNRVFAQFYINTKYGWGVKQFKCLDKIWTQESHWNHKSDNPESSAYGIPQANPGNKMKSVGKDWKKNPVTQIKWGAKYIHIRYITPCKAWKFKQKNGWY